MKSLALVVLLGCCVFAASEPTSSRPTRAQQIAHYFKCPLQDVLDLREQGFGYGEVVKILTIARLANRPVSALLQQYRAGVGWGTMCRQMGLSAVQVKNDVDRVRSELDIYVSSSNGTRRP